MYAQVLNWSENVELLWAVDTFDIYSVSFLVNGTTGLGKDECH